MVKVACSNCKRDFIRSSNHYYEAIRYGWKQFCSKQCLSISRTRATEVICSNPKCGKVILKQPHELRQSKLYFCSNSCSAKISNKIRELKWPKKYCANPACNIEIPTRNKYCSNKCQGVIMTVDIEKSREQIIRKVQFFYSNNGRIPMKREMWNPKIFKIFRSWNNVIISAGFQPNPVKFAVKHIADDGHKCDSLAEKIIDDWLFARKIPHSVKVPYSGTKMSADFKINDTLIEFFGLHGELDKYDKSMQKKKEIWKKQNLKVIAIFPNDLFPQNHLDEILKFD